MLSLLKAAFGGTDWGTYYEMLQLVGSEAAALFLAYITFMLLTVLNVIMGVFVEHTAATVREDRDMAIAEELNDETSSVQALKNLFFAVRQQNQADEGPCATPDGIITEKEFGQILKHDKVRAYFAVLGLEASHAQGLFKLLDTDNSGNVGLEEFIVGCLRLKGEAKAIDVATLMYENKRIIRKLNDIHAQQSQESRLLHDALRRDLSRLGSSCSRLLANGSAATRGVPAMCTSHVQECPRSVEL